MLLIAADLHPRRGGPPRVVVGSAVALRKLGVTVEVAAMMHASEEQAVRASWPELAAHDVALHLFERSGPMAAGYSRSMNNFVRRSVERFNVLHVHGVWEQSLAIAARPFQRTQKPYFVSAHGMLDSWSLSQSSLKKRVALTLLPTSRFLKRANAIVYGTEDEASEALHLRLGLRSAVVANGVDLALVEAASRDSGALQRAFPQLLGWNRTILFFSRIHPKKGLDLLVKAFARLAAKHPGSGLLAVGIAEDNAYEEKIRALVREKGLEQRLVLTTDFTGEKGFGAFELADLFALPSHQEGFSMAIVEAMALGKPLLITDRCHMNFLQEAGAGVVTGTSIDALEAGLDRLLSASYSDLISLGECGRALVQRQFTWDAVAQALLALYSEGERK